MFVTDYLRLNPFFRCGEIWPGSTKSVSRISIIYQGFLRVSRRAFKWVFYGSHRFVNWLNRHFREKVKSTLKTFCIALAVVTVTGSAWRCETLIKLVLGLGLPAPRDWMNRLARLGSAALGCAKLLGPTLFARRLTLNMSSTALSLSSAAL